MERQPYWFSVEDYRAFIAEVEAQGLTTTTMELLPGSSDPKVPMIGFTLPATPEATDEDDLLVLDQLAIKHHARSEP